jgi:hypothetical protein
MNNRDETRSVGAACRRKITSAFSPGLSFDGFKYFYFFAAKAAPTIISNLEALSRCREIVRGIGIQDLAS